MNPRYPIPAPFYSDIIDNFEPIVVLTAGKDCWRRAIDIHVRNGCGSITTLDKGIDPAWLDWPVSDRIALVEWPDAPLDRYVDLEKVLLDSGSPLVAGYVQNELRLRKGMV